MEKIMDKQIELDGIINKGGGKILTERIGETNYNKHGSKMTIVEYYSSY